jgi:hypothetical protein
MTQRANPASLWLARRRWPHFDDPNYSNFSQILVEMPVPTDRGRVSLESDVECGGMVRFVQPFVKFWGIEKPIRRPPALATRIEIRPLVAPHPRSLIFPVPLSPTLDVYDGTKHDGANDQNRFTRP